MVVVLPDAAYGDWLNASAGETMDFMRAFPAGQLTAVAASRQKGLA